ncbi:PAS domain S-box-containing protein [Dehalogenimonas formicexedens]|uniref:histidine kinase n=1 Tax=Dehalogenimonas formicexedens TaxID=1839801 RepID=A0A1P8FAL2_9CHLR|nr:ATP-binding protein [Dehalogenimonas formicexedens]APV45505.1 PAS domain S-box-containing protein [Dehalogenimonas formicexedens]
MASGRKAGKYNNSALRKTAEGLIARGAPEKLASLTSDDIAELVQELEVHQVELELQNEELREAQVELQESRDAYASLFDFAPVGYLILDRDYRVTNINFTARKILDADRMKVIKAPLSRFVNREDWDHFYHYMKKPYQKTSPAYTFELRMFTDKRIPFDAHLIMEPLYNTEGTTSSYRIALLDVTERKKADEELRKYRDDLEQQVVNRTLELRDLANRLVDIQEKERASIGTELHDDIGQTLTYATLLIAQAIRRPEEKILRDAQKSVQEAMAKTRDLSHTLSPSILKSAGLSMALECMAGEFERNTGIKTEFTIDKIIDQVPDAVALAAYRITQEALTNVTRHAAASQVLVSAIRKGDKLSVVVADNGIGFDPSIQKRTTGLVGMRERVLALGGEFRIGPNGNQGTRLSAEFPLPPDVPSPDLL